MLAVKTGNWVGTNLEMVILGIGIQEKRHESCHYRTQIIHVIRKRDVDAANAANVANVGKKKAAMIAMGHANWAKL